MADARATQGFVHTLSRCRQQPMCWLLEIAWRWTFGLPAMALTIWLGWRIYSATPLDGTGIDHMTFTDPMGAAIALHAAADRLLPAVYAVAKWLVPLLAVAWAVISGVGRTFVVRCMVASTAPLRLGTIIFLQMLRLAVLAASFAVWFAALRFASHTAVAAPLAAGGEPNLVLYFAIVIVSSLGLFTLWGVVSWLFFAAPLLAIVHGTNTMTSLRTVWRQGTQRGTSGPMVEINLVMGIVKIALIVLAMVFSAMPLPFEAVATPEFMRWWYLAVALAYCIASDFFHVARLRQYLDFAPPVSPESASK